MEDIDPVALAWLRERCGVVECGLGCGGGFDAALQDADAMVVRTYTRVDGGLLERAPRLRVVGRAGVGLDNIDVEACRARGVEVVHTPDANTQAVVEYVLALLFDLLRPRARLTSALALPEWNRLRRSLVAPRQLGDMRLGIIGLGRVGGRLARAAVGLGVGVVYHDIVEVPEERRQGARSVELEELLSCSDIVSVHVDARPGNRHFLHAGRLSMMKEDAVLVNTSRGFVVDAGGLAGLLRARPATVAVMDVHEPEPFGAAHPLLACENARLYPHLGAATATAHTAMSWVVKDVWRVLSGETAEWPAPRQ